MIFYAASVASHSCTPCLLFSLPLISFYDMNAKQLQITADGSHTIAIPERHVTYHSKFGAIQESKHVFIEAGLTPLLHKYDTINIFEMGFGTGLNALLCLQQAVQHQQKIFYYSIELYPLQPEEAKQLNYVQVLKDDDLQNYFLYMHKCDSEKDNSIHPKFVLHKSNQSLTGFSTNQSFNLIFFDAFAPMIQPELWTIEIFKKMNDLLKPEGILVTYCSKGSVRRAMLEAGFSVEKLSGAPGKREMIRALKK